MNESSKQASIDSTDQRPRDWAKRRRRKFVYPEIQVKIVLAALSCGVFALLMSLQLGYLGLWAVSVSGPATVEEALQLASSMLLKEFLIALVFLVPVAIVLGVTYSFRCCGPLYRFKKFFTEYPQGRWDDVLTLRKGDHLQDLKDAINLCLKSLKDTICSQQEALRQVRVFLEREEIASKQEEARRLLQLIETETRHFESKLGNAAVPPPEGSETQSAPSPKEEQLTPA